MNSIYMLLMSAFYILNVADNKYLSINDAGEPSLSSTPVAINFSPTKDGTGRYEANQKSWLFKSVDDQNGYYVIGYNLPAANTTNFLYVNALADDGTLATTFAEPELAKGQWKIRTSLEQDAQEVSLDEAEHYTPPQFTKDNVKVTFIRNFAAGKWNSLCVPFPVTKQMAEATWGAGTELATFIGTTDNKLYFQKCESIAAGTPCLLKPAKTRADRSYVITGIQKSDWAQESTPKNIDNKGMQYIGTYETTTFPSRAYVFGGTNVLYHLTSAMESKGYRAYIWDDTTNANPAKQLNWGWGTPTDIEILPATTSPSPTNIYQIDGKLAKKQATSTEGLCPGVYIMNGMKVVVK